MNPSPPELQRGLEMAKHLADVALLSSGCACAGHRHPLPKRHRPPSLGRRDYRFSFCGRNSDFALGWQRQRLVRPAYLQGSFGRPCFCRVPRSLAESR